VFIWVNVDHKESTAVIEKRETNNISMVKDILSKRKPHISKLNIDVS